MSIEQLLGQEGMLQILCSPYDQILLFIVSCLDYHEMITGKNHLVYICDLLNM
jgi:hypothetical protein